MGCIAVNHTLNLCNGGLQEVWEGERLKAALTKYEISYRESIGDVGPSTSVSGSSTN